MAGSKKQASPKSTRAPSKAEKVRKQCETADAFDLYERAVQDTEGEVDFISKIFRRLRKRPALRLREDFSGTAALCRQWVKSNRERSAVAVDLDQSALEWGKQAASSRMRAEPVSRIEFVHEDVRTAVHQGFDVTVAFNFSYWIFKQRADLLDYFKKAYRSLCDDGLFILDIWGGPEIHKAGKDLHEDEDFDWIWQWSEANPLTNEILCHIHFRFADGSKLSPAYTYDWRMWTVQEIREIALEAGFRGFRVFGEEVDDDGEETGKYLEFNNLTGFEAWWVYLVAER